MRVFIVTPVFKTLPDITLSPLEEDDLYEWGDKNIKNKVEHTFINYSTSEKLNNENDTAVRILVH